MYRRNLIVAFKSIKSNAVILPDSYLRQVHSYTNGCLALSYNNDVHYISWSPYGSSITETDIGINATVAKAIGLKEGALVKCSLVADVIILDSLHVTATSQKDWEMLEVSSYRIQSTILDQTRIVNNGQNLVIWINKAMTITVKINRLNPNTSHGRLSNNTEVIVTPFMAVNGISSQLTNVNIQNHQPIEGIENGINYTQNNISGDGIKTQTIALPDDVCVEKAHRDFNELIKSIKLQSPPEHWFRTISRKWEGTPMCNLYLTKYNLPEKMDINDVYQLTTQDAREYYINVRVISDQEVFPKNPYRSIEMSHVLMEHLSMQPFERIVIRPAEIPLQRIEYIELAPSKSIDNKTLKFIEHQFKEYILENTRLYPVLLNQQQIVKFGDFIVSTFLYPESLNYCLIDSETLRKCRIKCIDKVKELNIGMDDKQTECPFHAENADSNKPVYVQLAKYGDIIAKIVDDLKIFLCLSDENSRRMVHNIMLTGNRNSGRTTICKQVLERLTEKPFYCYSEIFNCAKHKGRKPESIQKDLRELFQKCHQHYPAIMVLDNLDILTQIVTEQTQDLMYHNKVSHVIAELIAEYTSSCPISVIVIVSNKENLNQNIYQSHGWHLFESILSVPNLDRTDREMLISNVCTSFKLHPPNPEKIANLTEGYQIGDVVQFIERAIYYAHRDNPTCPRLSNANLGESLSKTSAYCMEGIEQNTENMNIDDMKNNNSDNSEKNDESDSIAGMSDVIKVLEEVIVWPMKYQTIFNYAPLRVPSAVLLYGPPGTGKTHLMMNLAKCWHLRIISVKGPELLAKYIGQSEENVRNVFKRARAARPCILFFDEFDSLAPRRGHDSTGVTDRVVNQMLTELDGIEEQKGVILVAATCRPELIDPALLRPGRIDRHVECKVPNLADRLAIFKTLSKSLHFTDTVNLEFFSEKTENYTGADIQSILTTANMMAVKEFIAKDKMNIPEKIFIDHDHLSRAFNDTRPSLSKNDLAKYKLMYSRFSKKERSEMGAQKVSLA